MDAYNYHLEKSNRILLFKEAGGDIVVDPIEYKPETIYSNVDLKPFRGSNWNDAYEAYFEVNRIRMSNGFER